LLSAEKIPGALALTPSPRRARARRCAASTPASTSKRGRVAVAKGGDRHCSSVATQRDCASAALARDSLSAGGASLCARSRRNCGSTGARPGLAAVASDRPRRRERGALHGVVRDNPRTLDEAIEHGFAAPLPAFVRNELEAFPRCGVLAYGFA